MEQKLDTSLPGAGQPWVRAAGTDRVLSLRAHESGFGVWVDTEIAASDWKPSNLLPGLWQTKRPLSSTGIRPDGGDPQELHVDGRSLTYLPFSPAALRNPEQLAEEGFSGVFDDLYLRLPKSESLPAKAIYSVYLTLGDNTEGRWRVADGRFACDAIPVLAGFAEEVTIDIPQNSVLHVGTSAAANGPPDGSKAKSVFRVLLDGEVLFEHEQVAEFLVQAQRHRIELPADARTAARLQFEVEGPAAVTSFLNPVIAPLGAEAIKREQPDIILFLADTFRADNMEMYGAQLKVAPNLDQWAADGLSFRRAWSPAPWTLPAQASMLSGLWPYQHGVHNFQSSFASDAPMIARVLRDRGYRTVAITDAALVSERFGLDQGFEWFDELHDTNWGVAYYDSLASTLERAGEALDADDGRPLFLFIQSYRVHHPYMVSEQTRTAFKGKLEIPGDWRDLFAELNESPYPWNNDLLLPDQLQDLASRLEKLYRGGVVDFDRSLGALREDLNARGFFENGVFAFTSDHGEAFGEHKDLFHGNGVWESQVRIPLFLHGEGIPSRREDFAASLVDLPHTFAELAGVPAAREWQGQSLLQLEADRPQFMFECTDYTRSAQAMVDGTKKIILPEGEAALKEGDIREAYNLFEDPNELTNLTHEPWPEGMLEGLNSEAKRLRKQLLATEGVVLQPDDIKELGDMGYTDSGEE